MYLCPLMYLCPFLVRDIVGDSNNNISNCMIHLGKKEVINLKMAHN
jgi:hypothetical protein